MSVHVNAQRTGRFVEPSAYIALGASALVFLTLMVAPSFEKTLVNKNVTVSEGEPLKLKDLQLQPQAFGALRIETNALIPTNTWVTYEMQLLDKQGKVIASGLKEAWSESGYWSEEGESGSWAEDDLFGGIDVRAKKSEDVSVALAVLGYGNTSGQDLDKPVPFTVSVKNGVVDTRHLWPGLFWSSVLSVLALKTTRRMGKKAIFKKMNDSDPNGRETVGGANRLVRVNVDVESDETSPPELEVCLYINDGYGEQVYAGAFPIKLSFQKEKGRIEKATGKLQKFFILEQRGSYGFSVEVLPDAPVDRTTLTVRDGARTLLPVEAIHISSTQA